MSEKDGKRKRKVERGTFKNKVGARKKGEEISIPLMKSVRSEAKRKWGKGERRTRGDKVEVRERGNMRHF